MNILMVSWRDPKHPMAGGAEQVMHEHAKGWIKAGHDVTLFTAHYKGGMRTEILDEVKIIRYGYQVLGVHVAFFFWYLFGKNSKYDLIVDQFHGIPFFTPLYCRLPKLAVIQEIAREVWFLNHLPKPLNYFFGAIGYITEPFFFIFYRNVTFMTGSESAKEDLVNIGIPKENIKVVNHGVIINSKPRKIVKNKIKTIIFLGAITKDKGIEDALEAFKILNRKGRFVFWIVGKGSHHYVDDLISSVKKSSIKEVTKFWGFVSQKEKFELLSKSHILVNPSAKEGWGLVNIEANAVLTPVVAYNSKGLTDSVKDGVSGILCSNKTPTSIANEILEIFNTKGKYETLQKGANRWSRQFTWQNSIKKSLEIIDSIVKKY